MNPGGKWSIVCNISRGPHRMPPWRLHAIEIVLASHMLSDPTDTAAMAAEVNVYVLWRDMINFQEVSPIIIIIIITIIIINNIAGR